MSRPRRRPVLHEPRSRRRRGGRARHAAVATAVAVAVAVIAAASAATGGLTTDAAPAERPAARAADGAVSREVYARMAPGASREAVVALAGSEPVETRRVVIDGVRLECIEYARRSGRAGRYRFCFRGGSLWTKSGPPLGLLRAGR